MAFLNPAFLGFLALVGIPLLIHLIRRKKLKVVQWAAMEFLRQSQRKQKKRLRIEELILLALRMIIVACAVLAFCRPVLKSGIPLFSQNARVYSVIVLDNTFSMGQRSADGRTSFDRAQDGIHELLTHVLKDGDAVSIVLASEKPEMLVGVPSFDRKMVDRRVSALKLGDRASDNLASAQAVNRLLKSSKSTIKEVYWFSDDQANAWDTSKTDSARLAWRDLSNQASLIWVSAGAPATERDNLAVETPVLGRELVTPRLAARIESRILNFSSHAKDDLLVNLIIDGKPAGSTRVAVPAGGSATARFLPLLPTTGTHTGAISIADADHADSLQRDNSAPFVIRCRDSIKVLLQDFHPADDPSKSESFYLMNAMAPGGAAESLAPRLHEGAGLGNLALRDFDAVVLAGAGTLSPADGRVLSEYVKAGGGLLIFPGPDTDAARVNSALDSAGLVAAKLGERKTVPETEALTINAATITHPALTLFKDTASIDIASAHFTTYYTLEPVSDDQDTGAVKVMARFNNGDPALVERKVGMGHVVVAASSAGASWNQLALKPAFVPFVYQLVSYLGQGAVSHRNLRQDEPLFLSLPLSDANRSVTVTDPTTKVLTQNSVLDARGVTFNYTGTASAGVYKVAVSGSETRDAFAVGLKSVESNLAYAAPREAAVRAGVPSGKLTIASSPAQLKQTVNRARYGVEVWRTFLWALIPLLFLESLLAQVFGRRG